MTTDEMLARLHRDKVVVKVTNGEYWWNPEWTCSLMKNDDDVHLTSKGQSGDSIEAAIANAYNKFYGIVEKGLPEFSGAMIEHQPHGDREYPDEDIPIRDPDTGVKVDDDIPF